MHRIGSTQLSVDVQVTSTNSIAIVCAMQIVYFSCCGVALCVLRLNLNALAINPFGSSEYSGLDREPDARYSSRWVPSVFTTLVTLSW